MPEHNQLSGTQLHPPRPLPFTGAAGSYTPPAAGLLAIRTDVTPRLIYHTTGTTVGALTLIGPEQSPNTFGIIPSSATAPTSSNPTLNPTTGQANIILQTGTPPKLWIGTGAAQWSSVDLTLFVPPAPPTAIGFSGDYASANWTFANAGTTSGSVDTTGAPDSISITSGSDNSGVEGTTSYTIEAASSGIFQFDWDYTTEEADTSFDPFYVIIDGTPELLIDFALVNQSGSFSQAVLAGQVIGFRMETADNFEPPATVVISNFSVAP